jgi:hypothetical protein
MSHPNPKIPDILISLATPGVLLAALAGKVAAQSVQELGLWSEELLRGDRLPTLTNPPSRSEESPP